MTIKGIRCAITMQAACVTLLASPVLSSIDCTNGAGTLMSDGWGNLMYSQMMSFGGLDYQGCVWSAQYVGDGNTTYSSEMSYQNPTNGEGCTGGSSQGPNTGHGYFIPIGDASHTMDWYCANQNFPFGQMLPHKMYAGFNMETCVDIHGCDLTMAGGTKHYCSYVDTFYRYSTWNSTNANPGDNYIKWETWGFFQGAEGNAISLMNCKEIHLQIISPENTDPVNSSPAWNGTTGGHSTDVAVMVYLLILDQNDNPILKDNPAGSGTISNNEFAQSFTFDEIVNGHQGFVLNGDFAVLGPEHYNHPLTDQAYKFKLTVVVKGATGAQPGSNDPGNRFGVRVYTKLNQTAMDVDDDGDVDIDDIRAVQAAAGVCKSDVDVDGDTDVMDLLWVIDGWGTVCP